MLADQSNRGPLIGVLSSSAADDNWTDVFMTTFGKVLQGLGWSNLDIQYRFGAGDTDLTQVYAKELISLGPALIVAISNTSMAALHREATTTPIVFMNVSDPVGMGYVESLSRPGRSVTGFTPFEPSLGSKWLSLLKEVASRTEHLGVIFNPEPGSNSGGFLHAIESAAPSFEIKTIVTPHGGSSDIERTIVALGRTPHSGLVFLPDAFTYARREAIIELLAKQRVPAIYPWRDFVVAGGLISYGPEDAFREEQISQTAAYVNRILRGEKPADLPVQAPTKLVVTINTKAAKMLGLEIPDRLITLADELIE
jgi:putative ABC transport system substrate-binding protein